MKRISAARQVPYKRNFQNFCITCNDNDNKKVDSWMTRRRQIVPFFLTNAKSRMLLKKGSFFLFLFCLSTKTYTKKGHHVYNLLWQLHKNVKSTLPLSFIKIMRIFVLLYFYHINTKKEASGVVNNVEIQILRTLKTLLSKYHKTYTSKMRLRWKKSDVIMP